jgi:hypothetical protein
MKGPITFTREAFFIKPNKNYSSKQYILGASIVLLMALLHAAVVYAVVEMSLHTYKIRFDQYLSYAVIIYGFALIGFIFSYPVYVMSLVRPRKLVSYLIDGYRWHLFSKERLLFSYPILIIIPLDFSIFTFFKNQIPSLNAFWLDSLLCKLDRAIFLGHDPWRTLQQIIGDPHITRVLDFLYFPLWPILFEVMLLFNAFGRHSLIVRLRFFISYIIVWAGLGNALATVLSSAGPCYFTQVTGRSSPYAQLMEYLYSIKVNGVALYAIRSQEFLWNMHVNNIFESGSGISAMPSIHVATAALFALSMRKVSSILEKVLYIYAFFVWVGSIHLGWHYASDGLVSVVCVIVIWYYSGILTDKIIIKENAD